jgi:UPF0176 protein
MINLAFYRFSTLADPDQMATTLKDLCVANGLLGSLIVAHEGINGMLAGTPEGTDAFASALLAMPEFVGTHIKRSESQDIPFKRLTVKVKPEIVTLRAGEVDVRHTAPHLPPEAFRAALQEENVVVIDTRNDFEFQVGTFRGALNPQTTAFNEFTQYLEANREHLEKHDKILMFCTGGIRCEKATAWMVENGFKDVCQLQGGVLNFFEQIPDAHRDWDGELFVFDERITVTTDLRPSTAGRCVRCGLPITAQGRPLCQCGNAQAHTSGLVDVPN